MGVVLHRKWLFNLIIISVVLIGTTVFAEVIVDTSELHEIRLNRRSELQSSFSLLVIPVDFADTAFQSSIQEHLSGMLFGDSGQTLENYFNTASHGRCNFQVTLSPVVHLTGNRIDYSDIGWQGYQKIRLLAGESISSAVNAGLHLGLFDNNGPDYIPDSGDDDGEVDGILILHAGPGYGSNPDGLIPPLNYFLEDPVLENGITARFFSVASAYNSLGLIAHETAHLFGLEDRYDMFLSAGDYENAGGLGDFSLMSSGYRLESPSLLDAYSAAQLGWVDYIDLESPYQGATELHSGEVLRLHPPELNSPENEYYLAEVRGGSDLFDTHLPANQLIIYHVDENIPDDSQSSSGPDRHIRVAVVEADGSNDLLEGLDSGDISDLFPGSSNATEFSSLSNPTSWWYNQTSTLSLTNITSVDDAVYFEYSADTIVQSILPEAGSLNIAFDSFGRSLSDQTIRFEIMDQNSGQFQDGSSVWETGLTFNLGVSFWELESVPEYTHTNFDNENIITFSFVSELPVLPNQIYENMIYESPFIIDSQWEDRYFVGPGNSGSTTWQWQENATQVVRDNSGVLFCSGETPFTNWPYITYANDSVASIISARTASPGDRIAIVHYYDTFLIPNNPTSDIASITLASNDGYVDESSRLSFEGSGELTADSYPLWTLTVLDVPADEPHNIEFHFSADALWRGRGWLVHSVDVVDSNFQEFILEFDVDGNLSWHFSLDSSLFYLDHSTDGISWTNIINQQSQVVEQNQLPVLPKRFAKDYFRVRAETAFGEIVSQVISRTGSPLPADTMNLLSATHFNGGINLLLDLPVAADSYELKLFDIKGRMINNWKYNSGRYFMCWDGRDTSGRKVSAGCYIFSLSGNSISQSIKVNILK